MKFVILIMFAFLSVIIISLVILSYFYNNTKVKNETINKNLKKNSTNKNKFYNNDLKRPAIVPFDKVFNIENNKKQKTNKQNNITLNLNNNSTSTKIVNGNNNTPEISQQPTLMSITPIKPTIDSPLKITNRSKIDLRKRDKNNNVIFEHDINDPNKPATSIIEVNNNKSTTLEVLPTNTHTNTILPTNTVVLPTNKTIEQPKQEVILTPKTDIQNKPIIKKVINNNKEDETKKSKDIKLPSETNIDVSKTQNNISIKLSKDTITEPPLKPIINKSKVILYNTTPLTFSNYLKYPIGYEIIDTNNLNVLNKKLCWTKNDLIEILNKEIKQNNNPYLKNKTLLNNPIKLPTKIYNPDTNLCEKITPEYVINELIPPNTIVNSSLNYCLPNIPYNIKTGTVDYSEYNIIKTLHLKPPGHVIYGYNHKNSIEYRYDPIYQITTTISKNELHAPRLITDGIEERKKLEYKTEPLRMSIAYERLGDTDNIIHQIIYMNEWRSENQALLSDLYSYYYLRDDGVWDLKERKNADKENPVQVYNAYLKKLSPLLDAHADLFSILPFEEPTSCIFDYKIYEFETNKSTYNVIINKDVKNQNDTFKYSDVIRMRMAVWTEYGLVDVQCKPRKNTNIIWTTKYTPNGTPEIIIEHEYLPKFDKPQHIFGRISPRKFSIVTPLVDNEFVYRHIPICFQLVKDVVIMGPKLAIDLPVDEIFKVHHDKYYENFDPNFI